MKIKKISMLSDDLHRKRTEVIDSVLPRNGLVLEIGPNTTALQYSRKDCEVVTLDISPNAHPTLIANAEILPFGDSQFDFIIATEVIEHVRHPALMLSELRRVGKKGGMALISTPNVAHLTNRMGMLFIGDFYDDRNIHEGSDVGHIHFFTRGYFLKVLNSCSLHVLQEWNHFIPVTPSHYIDGQIIEKIAPGLTKQTMALCSIEK